MWRVLVAGGGPAGLYVCRNLLKLPMNIHIDLYEKSHSLYGLLSTGVSPDKLSIKSIIPSFDSILTNPNVKIHLGHAVGESILVSEIAMNYDFLILCTGSLIPRNIKIPGEVDGVFQALDFCNYYNGVNFENADNILRFLKDNPTHATVIGNGNVSLDVARMLLYRKKSLEQTLMSKQIINTMPELKKVYIIGRGGWINAKFTNAELGSILNSGFFHPIVSPSDYEKSLDNPGLSVRDTPLSTRAIERRKKMIEKMVDNYHKDGECVIEFIFHSNVTNITNTNAVMDIQIVNDKKDIINIKSNILFKALGFERDKLTLDLLSKENSEIFKNNKCHFFTVGWSRHGAKGDLSTTIVQAKECTEFVKLITSQFKPKNSM